MSYVIAMRERKSNSKEVYYANRADVIPVWDSLEFAKHYDSLDTANKKRMDLDYDRTRTVWVKKMEKTA